MLATLPQLSPQGGPDGLDQRRVVLVVDVPFPVPAIPVLVDDELPASPDRLFDQDSPVAVGGYTRNPQMVSPPRALRSQVTSLPYLSQILEKGTSVNRFEPPRTTSLPADQDFPGWPIWAPDPQLNLAAHI